MLELAETHGIVVYLKTSFLNEDEAAEHRKNLKEDLAALDKQSYNEYINSSTGETTL